MGGGGATNDDVSGRSITHTSEGGPARIGVLVDEHFKSDRCVNCNGDIEGRLSKRKQSVFEVKR